MTKYDVNPAVFGGGIDPFWVQSVVWPDVRFYNRQREIIRSVDRNHVTIVPAGNMLGKDYVAGFIAPNLFLRAKLAGVTCRIVTTSVKDDHLRVLWGEINRFIKTASRPLTEKDGGPLIVNHRDIRFAHEGIGGVSYIRGMVSERGEGMAGHHAEWTLGIIDEASGVDDLVFTQMETWAKRILVIGNPNPTTNLFYQWVKAGDMRVAA